MFERIGEAVDHAERQNAIVEHYFRSISSRSLEQTECFVEQLHEGVASVDLHVERGKIARFFRSCYTSNAVDFLHKAKDAASAGGYGCGDWTSKLVVAEVEATANVHAYCLGLVADGEHAEKVDVANGECRWQSYSCDKSLSVLFKDLDRE